MRISRFGRFIATPAALLLGLGSLIVLPSATAQASVIDQECLGTVTTTYSPGLTLAPKPLVTITTDADFSLCTDGAAPSGGYFTNLPFTNYGCLDLLQNAAGTLPLTWDATSGDTYSTFPFTGSAQTVGLTKVVTVTGTISAGRYAGDTAVLVITFLTADLLACETPSGLQGLDGTADLTITGL